MGCKQGCTCNRHTKSGCRPYRWTKEALDLVRTEYDGSMDSRLSLIDKLGVTYGSLQHGISKAGLARRTKRWTKRDEERLAELIPQLRLSEVASKLNRSIGAILIKCKRLGLKTSVRDGWYTGKEVCQILGTGDEWFRNRIFSGKLKAEPNNPERPPAKSVNSPWRVTEESLKDFITRYPDELTGRNVDMVIIVDILAGIKY